MENIKTQIKQNLKQISDLNFEKIYTKGDSKQVWNEYSEENLKLYITNILTFLKKLETNDNLFITMGVSGLNEFNNYLTKIINSYNNSNIINIDLNSLTTHHHDLLNNLNNLNNFIRSNGMYNEIKFSSDEIKKTNKEYIKIYELLKLISENKKDYERAIPELDKIIKRQGEITENAIGGQADAFYRRAEDHKIGGDFKKRKIWFKKKEVEDKILNYWFLSIILFSFIVGFVVYAFVLKSGQNVSAGESILRITSLIVPAYLLIFSANQYLYHKRMHEIYMFKYTSLNTMSYLISQNPDVKNEILMKGLSVLFSEPSMGKNNDNKLIVSELLSMLKGQLKN